MPVSPFAPRAFRATCRLRIVGLLALSWALPAAPAAAQPTGEFPTPRAVIDEMFIMERDGFNPVPGLAATLGRFYANNPGAVTVLGGMPNQPVFSGLDFRPGDNTLFAIDIASGSLRTVHPGTGNSTLVGMVGSLPLNPFRLGGLSFNASGNVLYATDSDNLYTVNTATGTPIAGLPLAYIGFPDGIDIELGDIAVAPIDVSVDPPILANAILGIAVSGTFGQPAWLARLTLNQPLARYDVTPLAVLNTGAFDVGYADQGLDFSPEGILYACLQGEVISATLFRVALAPPAGVGQCTLLGVVNNNPISWSVGDVTVGPNPLPACASCVGDVDGNGQVNGADIRAWVAAALEFQITQIVPANALCADLNQDGDIDLTGVKADLPLFLSRLTAPDAACTP